MPLRLDIRKKLSARSERVKCCDFHPTEPWILAALYTGHIFIWNYQSQSMVKSIEVCDLPVRCAKFIARKHWIVCGADDMQIRVYNYNTMERVKVFDAHSDYIRSIAIHPTLPCILSAADDMFIKMWDWEKDWDCTQTFEGHTHYVMQVEFNPKDTNTFASASLDQTIKVWGLNASTPHLSLEGHGRGVNCIGYFRGGDRPYLVSGADDHMVKVWDYQTKACVSTLEGHTNNVSAVCFHPQLPIILSGSEDGTLRIWHSNTYRLENILNYGMERVWSITCLKSSNKVALGYDDGTIMIKLGHEEPVVSIAAGKVVWAKNNEVTLANVKQAKGVVDGEPIQMPMKDLGNCDIFPQTLQHNPNGRFFVVCGDGEYIIYTALSLKNKSFGSALEFVWGVGSSQYATKESPSKIKVFNNFEETNSFRPSFAAEGIYGGALLGIKGTNWIDFYDWKDCRIVRRIDVCPKKVFWSQDGELLVLAADTSFFVLRFNRALVTKYLDQGVELSEQGIEGSFDLEQEVNESIRTGTFVGDCFIYTNSNGRLNYFVGGEVMTLAHLSKTLYILGYMQNTNRVYLMDKQYNVLSYTLLLPVLKYQTAIVRRELDLAAEILEEIPEAHHNKIARFLEAQGLKELALEVATDSEHKFELAIQCNNLQFAREILLESESKEKWQQLGDSALNQHLNLELAQDCFTRCQDLGGLLLIYTSLADQQGLERLAKMARDSGHNNVAFICLFLLKRLDQCIDLLVETDRVPEAAFLTRTYMPSRMSEVLETWKTNVAATVNAKAADALADPAEYPELFEDLELGFKVEAWRENAQDESGNPKLDPSAYYPMLAEALNRDLLDEAREGLLDDDDEDDEEEEEEERRQTGVGGVGAAVEVEPEAETTQLSAGEDVVDTDVGEAAAAVEEAQAVVEDVGVGAQDLGLDEGLETGVGGDSACEPNLGMSATEFAGEPVTEFAEEPVTEFAGEPVTEYGGEEEAIEEYGGEEAIEDYGREVGEEYGGEGGGLEYGAVEEYGGEAEPALAGQPDPESAQDIPEMTEQDTANTEPVVPAVQKKRTKKRSSRKKKNSKKKKASSKKSSKKKSKKGSRKASRKTSSVAATEPSPADAPATEPSPADAPATEPMD